MNNTTTLTPHKHAALIKEWADHVASGAVDAGWFYCQSSCGSGNCPWWDIGEDYRIIMTDRHPDYVPPTKKIVIELELTQDEINDLSRLFNGCHYSKEMSKLDAAFNKALEERK